MVFNFLNTRKKENEFFLVLDIGTKAVKLLICGEELLEDRKKRKIIVFGHSLEYLKDGQFLFESSFNLENGKKVVSDALEEARQALCFSRAEGRLKEKLSKQKKWPVFLTISPNILKSRTNTQLFFREKPAGKISPSEEKSLQERVIKKAQKEVSEKFASESGIFQSDIHWVSSKIIETKVDGYRVESAAGYEGEELSYKILFTFLPQDYFQKIGGIVDGSVGKVVKINQGLELLPDLCGNGLFLDIGGSVTQAIFVKNNVLGEIFEFDKGGRDFSLSLSRSLGMDEENARLLKEKYSNNLLSSSAAKRTKEILSQGQKSWYQGLVSKVEAAALRGMIPPEAFLYGGGSLLPQAQECLEQERIADLGVSPIFNTPEVKVISLKSLGLVEDATESLKGPQYIPSLLAALSQ